jgi:hypothetical protein
MRDDYLKMISTPSDEAKMEALMHPNGYVYVIDKEYKGKKDVPPNAILGGWKVDEKGSIIGPFIPNPNYKSRLS